MAVFNAPVDELEGVENIKHHTAEDNQGVQVALGHQAIDVRFHESRPL